MFQTSLSSRLPNLPEYGGTECLYIAPLYSIRCKEFKFLFSKIVLLFKIMTLFELMNKK